MDLSTLIGIVLGFVIIVVSITMDDIKAINNFINMPSLFIVVGGTIMAIVASYPFSILKNIPSHMRILFQGKRFHNISCIETLVEFATEARKNGLLALEQKAEELKDPFFKYAVMLIVDSHDPQDVRTLLNDELDYMTTRHETEISIYEKGTALAPAFGMTGTLIGLINMLMGLNLADGASDSLGASMSVALITTFYGCLLANLFFAPIAKKLTIRNHEEYLYKQLIIEGVLSIQAGDNPKFLKEKLYCYLKERLNENLKEEGDGGGKKKKGKGKKE